MSLPLPTIRLSGIPFVSLPPADVVDRVQELYEREGPAFVAHANVHTLNLATSDPGYADVLRRADMVLNDGKGVMLGARLEGERFPADLNGNHMAPLFLTRAAEQGWPVFFFGAAPGVADR
ncbi:MAG TPA: WecB/TagA/CpsF family glycosyltransferase, partial [Actinomycetota bacterium]|nr:WecB/TagA/CpsF family glycosyltransferase [Actinomycetota bacterium]